MKKYRGTIGIVLLLAAAALAAWSQNVGDVLTWNGKSWVPTAPLAGVTGPTGPTGSTGATGARGATGATGATGS